MVLYKWNGRSNVLVPFVLIWQIGLAQAKKLVLFRSFKGEQSFFWWTQDEIAEKTMQYETAEKTAGRVAPISACVLNQIDRLKSKYEAM